MKNHDFTPRNHIFSNFRRGARRVRPPLDPPLSSHDLIRCNPNVNNLDFGGRRGRDRMVLGFTTTYAITA